ASKKSEGQTRGRSALLTWSGVVPVFLRAQVEPNKGVAALRQSRPTRRKWCNTKGRAEDASARCQSQGARLGRRSHRHSPAVPHGHRSLGNMVNRNLLRGRAFWTKDAA